MSEGTIHPVVELMLARIKSHPEEFSATTQLGDRWGYAISTVENYGSAEDKAALAGEMRSIRLNEAHGWMMDGLLNGEERRAQEREESRNMKHQNAQAALQNYRGAGALQQAQQMTFANSIQPTNNIQLGQERLSESVLGQIKSKLGL